MNSSLLRLLNSPRAFVASLADVAVRLRTSSFQRHATPLAILLALLQRTPAQRVITAIAEFTVSSPGANVFRSAAAIGASLGAIHSLAGATTLQATMSSPVTTNVGSNVQIGFTVLNTINIGSWKITGSVPPGLTFSALEGGNRLTGPGTLDATTPGASDGYGGTSGGNFTTTPLLTGQPTQSGSYTFSLQAYELGSLGGLKSDTFSFTINVGGGGSTNVAPSFVTQPQNVSTTAGSNISFTVNASGTPAPTLQWQRNGVAISGATSTTLALNNVQTTDAGDYTVVATNSAGTKTSDVAKLTVTAGTTSAPSFLRQPGGVTAATGTTAVFSADVTGATSYQWRKNGVAISGATRSMLILNSTTAADAGNYTVVATNSAGSTTSSAASLAVSTVPANEVGHIVNLSIRTNAGTGAQTLIVGFAIGGAGTTGTKPLLVRAVGPTLSLFGLSGLLADPVATVYQASTVVASNDNWSGDATVSARIAQVNAFGFASSASLDAALALTPVGSDYTIQITGKNNGTGLTLAEIYDATLSGSFTGTTPRLINVSARTQVGTGSDVLIAGFVVGGTTGRTVLIRAIGPTLGVFGVGGVLADPKLELYSGATLVQQNDNWGGDAQLTTVGSSVNAFGIADASSKDSIMLVTLAPGLYSAQVSGVNNTTGVALIEVYEIP